MTKSDQTASTGDLQACLGCGKDMHTSAVVCPHCGFNHRRRGYKSKNIAGFLAFLMGGLGVHRFYLGQWWGIFYLLLIWTMVPVLIALIEAIVFWCSDAQKWDTKHNEGKPASPGEGGAGGVIIVIIVAVFMLVAVIGILAAVAIPAYSDYEARAKVSESIFSSDEVQSEYQRFYADNRTAPQSNSDIGLSPDHEIPFGVLNVTSDGITITFTSEAVQLQGKTVILEPYEENGSIEWACTGGTLENRHRLARCRDEY